MLGRQGDGGALLGVEGGKHGRQGRVRVKCRGRALGRRR
jgi:hypothetical protein